jgi:hypothetical protein
MTDRELLEAAAKAAGIEVFFDEDGDCYRVKKSGNRHYWNPLTDDGDALRLAVKLSIPLNYTRPLMPAPYRDALCNGSAELLGDDPYAATRRAIVRAAAEIGRQT